MIDDDYTEDDRWDWDRNDSSQYCKHGNFIGSWWGPDIMCGYCESGDPDITVNNVKTEIKHDFDQAVKGYQYILKYYIPLSPSFNEHLWNHVWNYHVGQHLSSIRSNYNLIDEIRNWAEDDDDNDWMIKRHNWEDKTKEN